MDPQGYVVPDWMKRASLDALRRAFEIHPPGTCWYCDCLRTLGRVKDEPPSE